MKRFKLTSILCLMFLLILSGGMANAQAVAIKKWKGRYPRMKNSYPHAFISFKGWLPPVPHLFVKTPLTHYYVKVKSVPATDSGEMTGKTKTGLLRIFSKLMERSQFKGRYKETGLIKLMNEFQKQIDQKRFDSRRDQLEDLYGLTATFLELYQSLDDFRQIERGNKIQKILKGNQRAFAAIFEDQSIGNRSWREIQSLYRNAKIPDSALRRGGLYP